MRRAILTGVLLLASCATLPPKPATAPPDWKVLAEESTVEVVTRDPDGDARETTVWLVVVDGVGMIRTGSTRWFANLQRNPSLELRAAGAAYPMRVELVTDTEQIARVQAAFRTKYGFQDRTVLLMRGSELKHMRLLWRDPK
jgi:hypothetical protein